MHIGCVEDRVLLSQKKNFFDGDPGREELSVGHCCWVLMLWGAFVLFVISLYLWTWGYISAHPWGMDIFLMANCVQYFFLQGIGVGVLGLLVKAVVWVTGICCLWCLCFCVVISLQATYLLAQGGAKYLGANEGLLRGRGVSGLGAWVKKCVSDNWLGVGSGVVAFLCVNFIGVPSFVSLGFWGSQCLGGVTALLTWISPKVFFIVQQVLFYLSLAPWPGQFFVEGTQLFFDACMLEWSVPASLFISHVLFWGCVTIYLLERVVWPYFFNCGKQQILSTPVTRIFE